MTTAFLVKITEKKNHCRTLFTDFCTPCSRSSPELSSYLTFLSQLSHFYKDLLLRNLLLTAPHMNLLCCNNLNLATLLPSVSDEVPHNCLMLMYHLLTPPDDLQKILLGNIYFSRFTDGSYLKGNNGKYCAGFATSTPFDSVETAPLLMATSAQHTELYSLTVACTLAKGKTANIYTNRRHGFRVPHNFGML